MSNLAHLPQTLHSEEQSQFVDEIDRLAEHGLIPPVILGVARFVLPGKKKGFVDHSGILATLPLVTADFWNAADDALQEFDWRIHKAVDVMNAGDFNIQWERGTRLFSILMAAGTEGSKRTDMQRQKAAEAIVAASKKLRRALDESTGFDTDSDFLGLQTPIASYLINKAGECSTGEPFSVTPMHHGKHADSYLRKWGVLQDTTLQEILKEAEKNILSEAQEISTDWKGRTRQTRFIRALQIWLDETRIIAGDDSPAGHYKPCVNTANSILKTLHPNVALKDNPAR